MTLHLFAPPLWRAVQRDDPRARRLADRHYSRQTPGARDWLPPGQTLALLSSDEAAVWGVCANLDPVGTLRWRVTLFRNESAALSSALIAEATALTRAYWRRHYGAEPLADLTTEVDPTATRTKRDPGRCFLRAGWVHSAWRRGLRVLVANPGVDGWQLKAGAR